jgi:hypothetical protein
MHDGGEKKEKAQLSHNLDWNNGIVVVSNTTSSC